MRGRSWMAGLGLLLGTSLLLLAVGEGLARLVTQVDADGNVFFRDQRIPPYRMPIEHVRELLETRTPDSYVQEDPTLGWTIRPSSESDGGLYRSNSASLRDEQEHTPGEVSRLRIGLFGDSFVHGDDVAFEDTIGERLETALGARGVAADVLNFGVQAYGMGQAYLRWNRYRERFDLDIVVLGFQPENTFRNVNLVRALYNIHSAVPFSKPRFVLDGTGLAPINTPTVGAEELPGVLESFQDWPLSEFEYWYDPEMYAMKWWRHSRLAALVEAKLRQNRLNWRDNLREHYRLDGEPASLTLRLVRSFKDSVEETGAEFVLLHLPTLLEIRTLTNGRPLAYEPLHDRLGEMLGDAFSDPLEPLMTVAREEGVDALFVGHYSPVATRIIADHLAAGLSTSVRIGS